MRYTTVPEIEGISTFQRNPKKIFQKVKQRKPVFITERSKPSAVIMDITLYQDLINTIEQSEEEFWNGIQEHSLQFWNSPLDDAYEQML